MRKHFDEVQILARRANLTGAKLSEIPTEPILAKFFLFNCYKIVMKISPMNKISFTSIPIHNVKLKKESSDGHQKKTNAKFSKLEYGNEDDISEMEHIIKNWQKAPYGSAIAHYFLSSTKDDFRRCDYYVVEKTSEANERQIYSIAKFDKERKILELLQSNPSNKEEGIKGAGEVMLWGIAKENEPTELPVCFVVGSSQGASGFYQKIGLSGKKYSFRLPTDNRDDFLDRIEKKYKFEA